MFVRTIVIVVMCALAAPAAAVAQAPVTIKLATLAPENSPWTSALRSMGAAWSTATGGRIRLTVYAGTIASESSALARMSVGGLQAATLTAAGLAEIDPVFNVFAMPFFFASDAELAYVQAQLAPMIMQRLEAKGFRLINWCSAGWVQLFSKKPIRTITELQNAKLYTSEGSPDAVQWYTSRGFHAVPLSAGEIPKQLKLPTGAIDAAPSPPVFALTLQIFRDAPNMLDLRVAPLVSATVMTAAAWNRIGADDQARMLAAAAVMQNELSARAPALDARAIDEMKGAGLNVIAIDGARREAFRVAAEEQIASQRGTIVPADIFDAASRARAAFRAGR